MREKERGGGGRKGEREEGRVRVDLGGWEGGEDLEELGERKQKSKYILYLYRGEQVRVLLYTCFFRYLQLKIKKKCQKEIFWIGKSWTISKYQILSNWLENIIISGLDIEIFQGKGI